MDHFILAEDLNAAEWRTPSLRYFSCKIKVPRLDHQVPADAVDKTLGHPSIKYSGEIQQAFFDQVSSKTSLVALYLGYPPPDPFSGIRWR